MKIDLGGKNIVLIGMSGCGKSRIARVLSRRLSLLRVDTDAQIRKKYGNIAELVKRDELHFRDLESEEVKKAASLTNTVIATGGGCVLRESNMQTLKKNGVVVYIKRGVDKIMESTDISGKPALSAGVDSAKHTFEQRRKLYETYADIVAENDGEVFRAVGEIISKLKKIK